uniref:BTB domain-containing protein n=1 Tax=Setaria viridis TaxID=4556 RepID=A0A4U6UCK9_SETVI|nr:hypothetical protein SEVIR_6G223600v2 [Setaria viridis]
MDGSMSFDSCSFTHQFKLNYEVTNNVAIGESVSSDDISAEGHPWRIDCYPHDVKAILGAFVMDRDGALSLSHHKGCVHVYPPKGSGNINDWAGHGSWSEAFSSHSKMFHPLTSGATLAPCTEGSDVSFIIAGEEFPAHRAVLAARSPVFKAQLLASMADAKMASITMHDIAPATFRAVLQYMYTDDLPEDEDDELEAATIGATLACAETYNCPELKKKCIDFFTDEKNFTKAVLTDGFVQLVQKFPSILAELRVKVGA